MREEEVAEGERKKQIKTEWTEEVKEEEEKLHPSADEGWCLILICFVDEDEEEEDSSLVLPEPPLHPFVLYCFWAQNPPPPVRLFLVLLMCLWAPVCRTCRTAGSGCRSPVTGGRRPSSAGGRGTSLYPWLPGDTGRDGNRKTLMLNPSQRTEVQQHNIATRWRQSSASVGSSHFLHLFQNKAFYCEGSRPVCTADCFCSYKSISILILY